MNEAPREFTDAARAMIPIIEALKEDGWNSRAEMAARVQEHITHLESQLATRNQAAEAMGVLELSEDELAFLVKRMKITSEYSCKMREINLAKSIATKVEAVLKAGGEG